MRQNLFAFAFLCGFFGLTQNAAAQPKPHVPAWPLTFSCVGELLVMASPQAPSQPVQALLHLDAPSGTVRWAASLGTLVDRSDTDTVRLDFSEADQRTFFTFQREALRDMALGKRPVVRGLFEDGFEFVDGYHTRRIEVVDCGVYNG